MNIKVRYNIDSTNKNVKTVVSKGNHILEIQAFSVGNPDYGLSIILSYIICFYSIRKKTDL
jgi:hypothetical protein